jgi:hypothetical protein
MQKMYLILHCTPVIIRSLDVTFGQILCFYYNKKAYNNKVNSEIVIDSKMAYTITHVPQNMVKRIYACIQNSGGTFPACSGNECLFHVH